MIYESQELLRNDYAMTQPLRNHYVIAENVPKSPKTVLYDSYRHMTSSKLLRNDYLMTRLLRHY